MLEVTQRPAPELKHDPYEETADGSHNGESVEIRAGDLILKVREVKSGIGDYFEVHAEWKGKKSECVGFGVHDDAEEDGMFP